MCVCDLHAWDRLGLIQLLWGSVVQYLVMTQNLISSKEKHQSFGCAAGIRVSFGECVQRTLSRHCVCKAWAHICVFVC